MPILVTIEHDIQELDQILIALAEKPFKEVAGLIAKLRGHGERAIIAAQTPTSEAPASETQPN
jgi:hypothetical protein